MTMYVKVDKVMVYL